MVRHFSVRFAPPECFTYFANELRDFYFFDAYVHLASIGRDVLLLRREDDLRNSGYGGTEPQSFSRRATIWRTRMLDLDFSFESDHWI